MERLTVEESVSTYLQWTLLWTLQWIREPGAFTRVRCASQALKIARNSEVLGESQPACSVFRHIALAKRVAHVEKLAGGDRAPGVFDVARDDGDFARPQQARISAADAQLKLALQ